MLKVSNLTKTYQPKKGAKVQALRGVDIEFPLAGMVFILGKSGSGKSTLLNILSGLDKADSGEISYGGKSFKDFSPSDFDSYRTYCGFIFQEYNLLPELSVEDNLALSIQLLGRKPSKYEIENALKAVDLQGYEKRQVNELSGGEKQRITIARGILKQPKIIFADEPTGALDNKTGRQVLDMLKLQSRDRLVIVVSHDAEFANNYADRIIELADGKIISDTDNSIKYDKENKSESKTNINGNKQDKKTSNLEQYQAIKFKLPLKAALKLGISSFKHRPFRLAITILLSAVAFTMFGLATVMASFDTADTMARALINDKPEFLTLCKWEYYVPDSYGDSSIDKFFGAKNEYSKEVKFDQSDINLIKQKTGLEIIPEYLGVCRARGMNAPPITREEMELIFEKAANYPEIIEYESGLSGYMHITKEQCEQMGFRIHGSLPQAKDEVAINLTLLNWIILDGYYFEGVHYEITSAADLIGRQLESGYIDDYTKRLNPETYSDYINMPVTVTGIIDTSSAGVNNPYYGVGFRSKVFISKDKLEDFFNYAFYQAVVMTPSDKDIKNILHFFETYKTQNTFFTVDYYGNEDTPNGTADAVNRAGQGFLVLKNISLTAAVVFALFAMLLLLNFINISISKKRLELGVIRAMGANKYSVLKIFGTESLIIALISFVLSIIATVLLARWASKYFFWDVAVPLLTVGIIPILALFAISVICAMLGSLIPILKAMKKSPNEIIQSSKIR